MNRIIGAALAGAAITAVSLSSCAGSSPSASAACINVADGVAQAILKGADDGVQFYKGASRAVRATDRKEVYFVAVKLRIDNEDATGIWATNSLDPNAASTIMAVDGFAQQFSNWPDADASAAQISKADESALAAKDCIT